MVPAKGSSGKRPTPVSFEELQAHIAMARDAMPKRLAQAAVFAMAHPEEFALGTAASIAEEAQVQPSTLVRLAHHLGYGGFSDLQAVFRHRLKNRASSYHERLDRLRDGLGSETSQDNLVLGGFLSAARASLDDVTDTLNADTFHQAARVLAEADTLYLIGRRRAFALVAHLSYMLGRLSIRSMVVNTANDVDEEIIQMARPVDAAIICSFSPYAPESVGQSVTLKRKGVPVVAITDHVTSPIAANATVACRVIERDHAGFRSLSAGMALAAALPVAIAEYRRSVQNDDGGKR